MAGINDGCKSTTGPEFPQPGTGQGPPVCVETPPGSGRFCPQPPVDNRCKDFQLILNQNDACFIDSVVNEALNIGGALFNVYKLLGVHEQGKLVDVTGRGKPISGGDIPGFPASNAFDVFISEWRSVQKGSSVLASAFIGYDFGEIKVLDQSRRLYGIDTNIRKHITAIAIKQSSDPLKRVTQIRVERSEDGIKWYGVAVIPLPDDDCLNTILYKSSVLNRYWRLRPLAFNGGASDPWGVQALQLFHNFEATHPFNIQDKILLENRDRDHAKEAIPIKGSYDLVDITTELSRFGIELPAQSLTTTVNFSATVAALGRPLIIGDIVEVPSEAQFSSDLRRIEKWMEVTDVAWSTEGYTPGWQPTLQRIILQPAFVSQETQDIFGDLSEKQVDPTGVVDQVPGQHPIFQDYRDIDQWVTADALNRVPEHGRTSSSVVRAFEQQEVELAAQQGLRPPAPFLQRIGENPIGPYVEDAMPPNSATFTEGTTFPTTPTHGNYHRLTYDVSFPVPARLYRFSAVKGRWVFLEKDRRAEFDQSAPRLQEFLTSSTRKSHTDITRVQPEEDG